MTQQEFTQRTKVEVSSIEFEMINDFYMCCECGKDEFCKMWCKMNKTRVENAKYERIKRAKDEANREILHKFYNKTNGKDQWSPIIYVRMSCREVQALTYAGITFANECGSGVKYLYDIRHEIGEYLGIY